METVVVAGMGAVTAFGSTVDSFWKGILDGQVAIRPVQKINLTGHRTRLGGEARHDPKSGRDPALDFAITAAREAMAQAGLRVSPERWGVILGTCNAGLRTVELAWRATPQLPGTCGMTPAPIPQVPGSCEVGQSGDWRRYLMIQPQVLAEAVASQLGIKGPVLSVNTACASAAHAIAHAVELIRSGQADAMLAGGTDAFSETAFAGFHCLESLSPEPAAPYSKGRQGLSLGEGAGMLVLTTPTIARAAGVPVLAEVAGYGLSADGYHPTSPHPAGEGAARAIRAALAGAGLEPQDVHYVNGHGTGTPKNDPAETNAVRRVLGDGVPLSSTKSMIGHLLGAAAAVEGIATVLALRDQIAPPTAGFIEPDPACGLDPVPGKGRPMPMEAALSNNFAFGGANATLAFTRLRGRSVAAPVDDVVLTGVGVVHAMAGDGKALWDTYSRGDTSPVSHVDLDPASVVPVRHARRLDRLGLFAVAACQRALRDARLDPDERVGVVLGTGIGPVEALEAFSIPVLREGAGAANPGVFPNTVYNAAAGQVAILLGARGPTSTVTASHAAGAAALCVAADLLRAGHADALLCPAVDALSPQALRVYRRLHLSDRITEGGIALVLERRSNAAARGARILGALVGQAITFGDGIERAMRTALQRAGLPAADLASIWANAIGHPAFDRAEQSAIERVVGPPGQLAWQSPAGSGPDPAFARQVARSWPAQWAIARQVRVHRPKLVLGEPVGAGAHQALVLALHSPDRGAALVNSSSLGGTHVSVVFKRE